MVGLLLLLVLAGGTMVGVGIDPMISMGIWRAHALVIASATRWRTAVGEARTQDQPKTLRVRDWHPSDRHQGTGKKAQSEEDKPQLARSP